MTDNHQRDRNNGYDNDSSRFRGDQGWRGSDQSTLGSLGVAGYDSAFRSGRGSFNDRDTGYGYRNCNSTPIDQRGEHYGRGPAGYKRSDELIQEDANEHLTQHGSIDATHITVSVQDGDLILDGTVPDRDQKHAVEELVERIHGVHNVVNDLRVQKTDVS